MYLTSQLGACFNIWRERCKSVSQIIDGSIGAIGSISGYSWNILDSFNGLLNLISQCQQLFQQFNEAREGSGWLAIGRFIIVANIFIQIDNIVAGGNDSLDRSYDILKSINSICTTGVNITNETKSRISEDNNFFNGTISTLKSSQSSLQDPIETTENTISFNIDNFLGKIFGNENINRFGCIDASSLKEEILC